MVNCWKKGQCECVHVRERAQPARVQISKQPNKIAQTNRALTFNEFYLYTDWSFGNHIKL